MLLFLVYFSGLASAETEPVRVASSSSYETGSIVYVAGSRVRLRADADADAATLDVLALGDALTVVDVEGEWTAVRAPTGIHGFVANTLLAPVVLEEDLDGDGVRETIAVTFEPDRLAVRVRGSGGTARTRLHMPGDVGHVSVSVLGSWEAGVPMIKVETPERESCGAVQWRHYVSYTGGRLQEAVSEYEASDAPYYSGKSVQFLPVSGTAVLLHEQGDHFADEHTVSAEILVLEDGVYRTRSEVTVELESLR